MPIYEYRRPDGTTFEVLQKFSDDALTHDPDSGVPVQRVLSAPAIHFKGSGFHNTDYGTKKRPVGGGDSGSGDGGSSGASTKSGDGASAAKGDAGAAKSDGGGTSPTPASSTAS